MSQQPVGNGKIEPAGHTPGQYLKCSLADASGYDKSERGRAAGRIVTRRVSAVLSSLNQQPPSDAGHRPSRARATGIPKLLPRSRVGLRFHAARNFNTRASSNPLAAARRSRPAATDTGTWNLPQFRASCLDSVHAPFQPLFRRPPSARSSCTGTPEHSHSPLQNYNKPVDCWF